MIDCTTTSKVANVTLKERNTQHSKKMEIRFSFPRSATDNAFLCTTRL